MAKYNEWSVVFNEQPSETKWNILGDNDSYHEEVVTDGWVEPNETWTYASADSPTFTFTISGDKTLKYTPGTRIRLKQSGAYKYFIITVVAYSAPNTTVTVYGGTDYTLANAAITDNWFSQMKSPVGFPLNPVKWTIEGEDTTSRLQLTPVASTWYNLGSFSITIPIGAWRVEYFVSLQINDSAAAPRDMFATLSTANNSQSDATMTTGCAVYVSTAAGWPATKAGPIVLTVKTIHYLNSMTSTASVDELYNRNDVAPAVIRAVCAYL